MQEIKNIILRKNENFIEENNLSDFGLSMSSYSPFLFKSYDTYTDYQNEKQLYLSLLDSSDSVSTIYIFNENLKNESAYVDEENCNQSITLEEAKEMIQIYDSNYTGKEVKIGIIDVGIPSDINFPKEYHKLNPDLEESAHTTYVASILGGKYGIAPDAELYFGSMNSVTQSMEWMLGEGVNVVNCSYGYDYENGIYLGYSAYFDYIIRHNFISIVKSSGNEKDSKIDYKSGIGIECYNSWGN
ncbi:MAG: S8/S53 family peptidase [Anaeroplasmataceae bacterium]|nr:S8/S53 family peptidase [Anaeroplasmataceae bacterium]